MLLQRRRPAEIYSIRAKSEWATICLDEQSGTFMAYSSFGTFAYSWQARGGATLKEFLRDLNRDYFFGKTCGRAYEEFDLDATIKGMRTYLLEQRRAKDITESEARDAWRVIDNLDDGGISADLFADRVYRSTALGILYGGDYYDICKNRPNPQCAGFWEVIWPEFLKQIAPRPSLWQRIAYQTFKPVRVRTAS